MSEVEGTEELNDENTVKAPAEELVELILTGELHAANQKFNSIIEDKVVESIEEEKHKISQTLFAEDEEEADEGKIPPQFLKGKDKDDDDDSDDDDDDDSDDDDSDSDDSDDSDDDDDDKPKKGKVPPQFAKKTEEGITGDPEANEKAIAKNREMAKKYGQVRQGIPPEKEKKEEVEPVDELSNKKLADAQNKAGEMALAGSKKAAEQGAKFKRAQQQDRTADGKPISVSDRTTHGVRKLSVGDKVKKAATKGAEKLGLKKRPERATGNPYGPEKMSRPGDHRYGKAPGGSLSGGYADHFDPEQSFDPGEESANVELPKDSFVQSVSDHLAGKRI